MKNEYQVIDECTRQLIEWRSKCGAMGWYQMDEKQLRAFVKGVVQQVKSISAKPDVIKSVLPIEEVLHYHPENIGIAKVFRDINTEKWYYENEAVAIYGKEIIEKIKTGKTVL